jgi:hypothetical protein
LPHFLVRPEVVDPTFREMMRPFIEGTAPGSLRGRRTGAARQS